MSSQNNLEKVISELNSFNFKLIAVSKNHPVSSIQQIYQTGHLDFGENKVQELTEKAEQLPKDIRWHMIGHLQRNKVKYIAPFICLIHSVDSFKLLQEINKEALKNNRIIDCLLQIHIATEESKFGLSEIELFEILGSAELRLLKNIKLKGLMGMATNTDEETIVRSEFKGLKTLFEKCKVRFKGENVDFMELSIGMSSDYKIALEEGSTLIRIGTAIFGNRKY